jgi:DNA invertase Pin-like site-specific DNA recombinase
MIHVNGHCRTEIYKAAVLFAEVSRMARSTLQVLEMLACCMQRGVHVHIAKQQMVLDGSLPSRITATVLGLAAEIEREFIAMRTREALAKRRAEGKPLGRPKGKPAARLKLDAQEAVIRGYLAQGINKLAIAKLIECAPSTLYTWLARRNLRPSPGRDTRPGPVGDAVRGLWSGGEERREDE